MKYVGLCGLHGAGKTHIAARLCELGNWKILDKRLELKQLYENGWSRRSKDESWEVWYRSIYERFGSGAVMLKLLETISSSSACVIVIDAIHTPEEWLTLQGHAPGSILAGVWAPQAIRDLRRDEPIKMDARRTHFWHHNNDCLMSRVEWAFPGSLSSKLLDNLCQELITYVSNPS